MSEKRKPTYQEIIKLCNKKDKEIERLNFNLEALERDFLSIAELLDLEEGCTYYDIVDKIKEIKESNGAIPPEVIGTNGEDGGLFDYGDR